MTADLRNAKWLDPQCADRGACQSLIFKRQRKPLELDQIIRLIPQYPINGEKLIDFARAIEAAHLIGCKE